MHVREMREEPVAELDKYIILDTHGGHEDVIGLVAALRLATKNDRIVLGITCVGGRRKMDSCVRDALIAQQIAGTSFPVFKGILFLIKVPPKGLCWKKNILAVSTWEPTLRISTLLLLMKK